MPLATTPSISETYNGQAARTGPPPGSPAYIDFAVAERYPKALVATPAQTAELNGIFKELKMDALRVAPSARLPDNTFFYVVEDPKITGSFIGGPRGSNAAGVVVSTGALKSLDRDELKFMLAHEMAHDLFRSNPELRNDPRFQPRSAAAAEEMSQLHFGPGTAAVNAAKAYLGAFGEPFTEKDRAALDAQFAPKQKDAYIEEIQADKLGLWLTKNQKAADSFLLKMTVLNGDPLSLESSNPGAKHAIENSIDPHATMETRQTENIKTNEDIQAAGRTPAAPALRW